MLVETLFCVDAILSKVIKSSKISRLQGLDVKKKMVHQILKLKVKNLIYLQVDNNSYWCVTYMYQTDQNALYKTAVSVRILILVGFCFAYVNISFPQIRFKTKLMF